MARLSHLYDGNDEHFQMKLSSTWPKLEFLKDIEEDLIPRALQGESIRMRILLNEVPWIHIPATRINLPLSHDNAGMRDLVVHRTIPENLSDVLEDHSRQSLYTFDGRCVYNAIRMIEDQLQRGLYGSSEVRNIFKIKSLVHQCTYAICREILIEGQLPSDYIGEVPVAIKTDTPQGFIDSPNLFTSAVHSDMKIITTDTIGSGVFAGDLSHGTQATLLWIWYLAIKMASFHEFKDGWEERGAILLIDEVENHLHPTWQRRVIPALLEHFPGLQIFATTHSPFVVAGRKSGQVHKLYKNDEGQIQTEPNNEDIVGWTVEDILREFMEVDDPTDAATAEAAATLRWLRYQRPQDGTAGEWRQEKISQLESNAEATGDEISALRWLRNQNEVDSDALHWWETEVDKLRAAVSRELEVGSSIEAQRELLLERLSDLMQEDASHHVEED
jgi:hypothetical protein